MAIYDQQNAFIENNVTERVNDTKEKRKTGTDRDRQREHMPNQMKMQPSKNTQQIAAL